jgi:hypothetical protein
VEWRAVAQTSHLQVTAEKLSSRRMVEHRFLHLCADVLTLDTVVANGGSAGIDGIRGRDGSDDPKVGHRPRKPCD